MKRMAVMIALRSQIRTTWAQGQQTQNGRKSDPMQTITDITMVAPALEKYAHGPLTELWKRPGRTARDRSIVTIAVANGAFADRKIGVHQLPAASPTALPLDKDGEAKRAVAVEQQFGNVAPGIVQYTTDVLFRDVWLRPDLAPRDRSLVTVSALIASGQVAQIP